ncbi:MAG: hypothetical protein KDD53_10270, partial [Bdellovibrionales bacterium]|nr:hypothetical protein [Bdellovibrionales bacterium]
MSDGEGLANEITLKQVVDRIGGALELFSNSQDEAVGFRQVCSNSQQIRGADSIFVAVKGNAADGHLFISDAISRGAVCCVAESYSSTIPKYAIKVEDSRIALSQLASLFNGDP